MRINKPLSLLFVFTLTLVILSLIFSSCKKNNDVEATPEDELIQKFFQVPDGSNEALRSVIAEIKKQDSKYHFAEPVTRKYGLPLWKNALTNSSTDQNKQDQRGSTFNDSLIFFIPFQSLTSSEITSYLVCLKIHADYNFRFYRKNVLDTLNTTSKQKRKFLRSALSLFAYFEKEINEKDSLFIGGIYKKYISETSISFDKPINTGRVFARTSYTLYGTEVCYKITCSGGGDEEQPERVSSFPTDCYNCNSYWYIDWGGGGGGTSVSWWFDDGGGSIDSGNGYYPYTVSELIRMLNLNAAEADFLTYDLDRANEVLYYLQTTSAPNKNQIALWHIDKMIYDAPYLSFVENHAQSGPNGIMWWEDNSFLAPYGSTGFGDWAINYLVTNPQLSFSTFQNQFIGGSEGLDGDYDSLYWDDPNLTFPPQNLPSWNAFNTAYPKHNDPSYDTPLKMYTSIGGQVLNQYNTNPIRYQNTCALRMSKALNYSGVTIPAGTDRYQGADGKYYFLSASALFSWMKKTFGTPTGSNHLTGDQGGTNGENFPNLLSGKKGIYIMTPNYPGGCDTPTTTGTGFCASGHADMIENGVCSWKCYFNARGGVHEIFIWELQ